MVQGIRELFIFYFVYKTVNLAFNMDYLFLVGELAFCFKCSEAKLNYIKKFSLFHPGFDVLLAWSWD